MHTKDLLSEALRTANLPKLADRASRGLYHDFLSPLPLPATTLYQDLLNAGTLGALALLGRVRDGEFEASPQEAEEWGRSEEAQDIFQKIMKA